mgnify:CR=1 FL=1|jgi:hypothetical protein
MTGLAAVRERSLALFFLALLAFSPALLVVFSRHVFLFGVPLLYVYLFGVWGGVILCIGLNAFPRDSAPPEDKAD